MSPRTFNLVENWWSYKNIQVLHYFWFFFEMFLCFCSCHWQFLSKIYVFGLILKGFFYIYKITAFELAKTSFCVVFHSQKSRTETTVLAELVLVLVQGPVLSSPEDRTLKLVWSGFFPIWAQTGTATDCLISAKCKNSNQTAHNRLCAVRSQFWVDIFIFIFFSYIFRLQKIKI